MPSYSCCDSQTVSFSGRGQQPARLKKNIEEQYSGKAVKYPPRALLVHFCSTSEMFFPRPYGALRMEIKRGVGRWENMVTPGRDLGLTRS